MGRLSTTDIDNVVGTPTDNVFLTQLNQREIFRKASFKRDVFYMAHPVSQDVKLGSPTYGERGPQFFRENIDNAKLWMAWLMENDRSRVYIAPWITEVQLVDENMMTTTYDEALLDDEEVVRRLDGIILVGGTITQGMARERVVNETRGNKEIDWSSYRTPWERGSNASEVAKMLLRHL
jgi:hypothetical protein